ncbi:MAG: TIGR00341 family protein [Silicimonas sp.]|nr:TIGR00341 family protein [Silicimonas sp.]
MITVSAPDSTIPNLIENVEDLGASGIRMFQETQRSDRTTMQMLVGPDNRQALIDCIQSALSDQSDWRITILPIETTIPLPSDEEEAQAREKEAAEKSIGGMTREEIWNTVWRQARLDETYIAFVILSTIVAALGMLTDSLAVVVGAMVIAPLLGPNLAFAVGVALGDGKMIGRAMITNFVGIALAFGLSVLIGYLWEMGDEIPSELMARSDVRFDGLVIAVASGAAAALSLVTGVSSALVGVMVAVALLPPTSAVGIFLATGHTDHALGALLLLGVNIVSVNIAAHSVLLWRGVRPRTFFENKKAARGRVISGVIWVGLLLLLIALMVVRSKSDLGLPASIVG